MYKQTILRFLIVSFVLICLGQTIDAQRKRSRPRERVQENEQLATKWLAIHMGNIGFGSGFSISSKLSAGVEFEDRFAVGLYGKFFYDIINRFGASDLSLFSPGFGGLARIKITDEIFVQGEYSYTSFEQVNFKDDVWYPMVGGGYSVGQGKWTYGFTILLILSEEAREASFNTVEYWIDFTYNF